MTQFGSGFNERLFDIIDAIPGLPIATVNAIMGRGFQGPLVTEELGLRDIFVEPPLDTPLGRAARRTGQELGASAPLAAVPLATAAQAPIRGATNVAQRAGEALLAGIRNTPLRAALGELAATTGAGIGAGIAQEIEPGSQLAEVTGQLAGGVAPTVLANTPAALATRLARGVARRVSPAAQTQAARQEVAQVIGPEVSPEVERGIAQAEQLRQEIPGFDPSLAEASGAQSLIRTQRDIENRAVGPDLDALVARRAGNVEAVDQFARQNAPVGPDDFEFVVQAGRERIESLTQRTAAQQADVQQRQQDLAAALPEADRPAVGARLRETLIDLKRAEAERMSRLASEAGLNDVDISLPFREFQEQMAADFAPRSIFEDSKNVPEILSLISEVKGRGGANEASITFQDLMGLRTRITDDLRDAQSAANPSRRKIRALAMLKERVDETFDGIVESVSPGLAEAAAQFRETYKREFIDRFEQGVAFKVRQKDGRGFYKTPDEKVAAAFFAPGDIRAARQFKATFGEDPQAQADLATAALDSLRDAAVRDGTLDPSRLGTWQRRHASVLAEFPEIQAAVNDTDNLARGMAARQAELDGRNKKIENLILAREIARLDQGGTTEQAIQRALANPKLMSRLKRGVRRSPEARTALKRAVWDEAVSLDNLSAYIGENEQSLKVALGEAHLGTLRKIANARDMIANVPPARGAPFRPDPTAELGRQLGQGVPQIGSRVFAIQSGRIGWRYMLVDMGGRLVRGRSLLESEELLREALYDPQVAKDMHALLVTRVQRPAQANRINSRLFNLGAETRRDQLEDAP